MVEWLFWSLHSGGPAQARHPFAQIFVASVQSLILKTLMGHCFGMKDYYTHTCRFWYTV